LNADVIKQAKELGMNLSGFMEIRLREYLTIINQEIVTPRRRFELGFTSKKCIFSPVDHQKNVHQSFFICSRREGNCNLPVKIKEKER